MSEIENCPMRHENGNCLPVGGVCAPDRALCSIAQAAYVLSMCHRHLRASKWARVEDRRPVHEGWALVCITDGWVTEAWWDGKDWGEFTTCTTVGARVTHWMPLPAPPAKPETEG